MHVSSLEHHTIEGEMYSMKLTKIKSLKMQGLTDLTKNSEKIIHVDLDFRPSNA